MSTQTVASPSSSQQHAPESSPSPQGGGSPGAVQMKAALAGKSYDVQMSLLDPNAGGRAVQMAGGGGEDPASVHAAADAGTQGAGGSLPHLDTIQAAFGAHDISNVQAYSGGAAQEANQAMGAEAYATGDKIAFADAPDVHTAAHEAAHVVQQSHGVSLSGGVGQSGDAYEQHADQVADAVVAGKSAEPILNEMAGGGGDSSATQMKAVQRVGESGQSVSASERATVDTRAADRGVGLESREQVVRGTHIGVGQVNAGATSMAENPDFERDALAFEARLASDAYVRGNAPATEMAHKAKDYMAAKAGGWDANIAALKDMLKKCGSEDPRWSGSVGLGVTDLMNAFDTGNCAVKMCHMEAFYTQIIVPDIKADIPGLQNFLAQGRIAMAGVERFRAAAGGGAGGMGGNAFHIPEGSSVAGQGLTRALRDAPPTPGNAAHDAGASTRQVGAQPAEGAVGTPTPTTPGIRMDPAEIALQREAGGAAGAASPEDQVQLHWQEGANLWAMNEYNKWVFQMRQLSIPLMAGPSGTTNKLMNLGSVLGVDPVGTRLACMGYLLPARHHSLVEVMEAAEAHGCGNYVPGRQMYTDIKPWTGDQLKAFGGGKFPHEGARPEPGAGGV